MVVDRATRASSGSWREYRMASVRVSPEGTSRERKRWKTMESDGRGGGGGYVNGRVIGAFVQWKNR